MLEVFLCRALGEFTVSEAVPPLVEAAGRMRPEDIAVRCAALEGLAVYAANPAVHDTATTAEIRDVLLRAAADQDTQIRSVAAFALGVLEDETSLQQLRKMLIDAYPDVRYNAATGLARHGDAAGYEVILEMLDPQEQASLKLEADEPSRAGNRVLISTNGLQAALSIHDRLTAEEREKLRQAIDRLATGDEPPEIRLKAANALRQLDDAHCAGRPLKVCTT